MHLLLTWKSGQITSTRREYELWRRRTFRHPRQARGAGTRTSAGSCEGRNWRELTSSDYFLDRSSFRRGSSIHRVVLVQGRTATESRCGEGVADLPPTGRGGTLQEEFSRVNFVEGALTRK